MFTKANFVAFFYSVILVWFWRIVELLEHAECCSITNHFTVWITFQCFQQCLAMIWFHMVNDDVIKVATIQ